MISDTGQNLRVNVDDGVTLVDGTLTYPANPPAVPAPVTATGVAGAAYTNNDADPNTGTSLFDIDTVLDQVVAQAPANAGLLSATGKLTLDTDATDATVGFDAYTRVRGGTTTRVRAFASLRVGGETGMYSVTLGTGRAEALGTFDADQQVVAVPLEQR